MKHHFYAALATLVITFGVALAVQPSFAQTTSAGAGAGSAKGAGTGSGQHNKQNQSKGNQNPACQKILDECKKMGFIQGQWKKDNGLWKDCFDPIVKGHDNTTQDGKPIKIPVSQEEIDSCRESKAHQHNKQGSGTQHNQGQANTAPAVK